jgi:hypothetical protein
VREPEHRASGMDMISSLRDTLKLVYLTTGLDLRIQASPDRHLKRYGSL